MNNDHTGIEVLDDSNIDEESTINNFVSRLSFIYVKKLPWIHCFSQDGATIISSEDNFRNGFYGT